MAQEKVLSEEALAIHKKFKLSGELLSFALEIKKTQLKKLHPLWTDSQCLKEAVKLIQKN